MIVGIYVDDCIGSCTTKKSAINSIESLEEELEVTTQPLSPWFFRSSENRDPHMHQTKDIDEILTRFNMIDCEAIPAPCDATLTRMPAHVEAAKRALRYLKGTRNLEITYKAGEKQETLVFSDADHDSMDHESNRQKIRNYHTSLIWTCCVENSKTVNRGAELMRIRVPCGSRDSEIGAMAHKAPVRT